MSSAGHTVSCVQTRCEKKLGPVATRPPGSTKTQACTQCRLVQSVPPVHISRLAADKHTSMTACLQPLRTACSKYPRCCRRVGASDCPSLGTHAARTSAAEEDERSAELGICARCAGRNRRWPPPHTVRSLSQRFRLLAPFFSAPAGPAGHSGAPRHAHAGKRVKVVDVILDARSWSSGRRTRRCPENAADSFPASLAFES